MTRICLLAFWIFSTLILFPCTSVDAKEGEVRIYLDYVMPIFGDADGKAKAIVGLTFKNLTSDKFYGSELYRTVAHLEYTFWSKSHGGALR